MLPSLRLSLVGEADAKLRVTQINAKSSMAYATRKHGRYPEVIIWSGSGESAPLRKGPVNLGVVCNCPAKLFHHL